MISKDNKNMILALLLLVFVVSIGLSLEYLDVPKTGIAGYLEKSLLEK